MAGTTLKFSTIYHPQTQVGMKSMNTIVRQTLWCIITKSGERVWKQLLSIAKMTINLSPISSTWYTPIFLNCSVYVVAPMKLLSGDKISSTESDWNFVEILWIVWVKGRENLKKSVVKQAWLCNKKHRERSSN